MIVTIYGHKSTSIVLPGKLDRLTAAFKNNDNIDMVIGAASLQLPW